MTKRLPSSPIGRPSSGEAEPDRPAIRPTAVAGLFYPKDPAALLRDLDALLDEAVELHPASQGDPPQPPKALIAPHAGYIYSGLTAALAYAPLSPFAATISRVILLGPSHRVGFGGLAACDLDAYDTPLGPVPVDREWMARLDGMQAVGRLNEAHAAEHALEVHLPFLMRVLGTFTLVPIVCGEARASVVAEALDRLWGGPETLIVVSTDLSHYLDYDSCRAKDRETAEAIDHLDATPLGPHEACGHVPLSGLLRLARTRGLSIERIDLRNSGDTAGSRDRVVGYGSWRLREASTPATG
ncbi:MAG: AmmeMemoRadiSam system protein B [Rhodospirillum sp.]|nr:AmmeMemoRadiSam system protein B [Rhodospirillum sp.]MCF8488631.1 AmmeMemoRadiSam system protein B [Rhodospirillum sp.]MCF8500694.1 AmmeMemoRadiSam system protein B [Rhodospirillum sp.]